MSLRDEIAHRLCALLDDDWSLGKRLYRSEARAILALVLAHATSDEAVERSLRATAERLWTGLDGAVGNVTEAQRAAILAALGEGE